MGRGPLVQAPRQDLVDSLARKADEFADVLKTGRTHLQDAVPITLGQEFGGYAACVRRGAHDVVRAAEQLRELNIGATAVGTGLNAGDDYRRLVVGQPRALHEPAAETGGESVPRDAEHGRRARVFERDAPARGGVGKVASDLRLLSMGPRAGSVRNRAAGRPAGIVDHAGQGESVGARDGQPGVLPGDGVRHDGRDRLRGRPARAERDDAGHRLERAARVDDSARGDEGVPRRCVDGITADDARARELLDRSTATATALSPYIGTRRRRRSPRNR